MKLTCRSSCRCHGTILSRWSIVAILLRCATVLALGLSAAAAASNHSSSPSDTTLTQDPSSHVSAIVVSSSLCPDRCRCPDQHLTVVNCHGAGLRRVPFPLPRDAIVLDLDHNRMTALSNDSFDSASNFSGNTSGSALRTPYGCDRLEIISAQDNFLSRIEPGAFALVIQLRILRLGRNRLTSLPVGLFDGCHQLQVLDLHGNLLTGAPPDHVVFHLHGLVSLNVSRNRLTSPVLGAGFRYSTQLGDIDLSGNDFPTIDSDVFDVARYWDDRIERRINLSACNIRRLHPAALLPVRRLRSISLSGNPRLSIEELRAVLGANDSSVTRHLEKFELSWNSAFRSSGSPSELFSDLHGARLDHLTELSLAGNRISQIPTQAFRSLLPDSITIEATSLPEFSMEVAVTSGDASREVFFTVLRGLDLSWNHLTSVGTGLAEVGEALERLRLTGNRLSNIEDDRGKGGGGSGLERLRRLLELDLSHNEISRLTGGVLRRGPSDLRQIDVSYNRIRDIDDDTLPVGLEMLIARGNRIIDVSFLRLLPRLHTVDLSNNAIVSLGSDVFASVAFGIPSRLTSHIEGDDSGASTGDGNANHDCQLSATLPTISANFSRNEISHIEPDAFRRMSFNVLDMSENRLTRSSSFGWLSIDVLFLDGNELTSIDVRLLFECEGPMELYASRNRLQTVFLIGYSPHRQQQNSSSATTDSRLVLLDVSDNPDLGASIEHPTDEIGPDVQPSLFGSVLYRLEVLRAGKTNLRRLPTELVKRLRSLRVLDVSGNQLGVSDPPTEEDDDSGSRSTTFEEFQHLREIDVSGNRLTQFPLELLRGDGSELRSVRLNDNPWRCNCSSTVLCRVPMIERLIRNNGNDAIDDDVIEQIRCDFAVSRDEATVSISIIELCHADSAFHTRCHGVSPMPMRVDDRRHLPPPSSWKLIFTTPIQLETDLRRRHLPPPSSWKLICTTPIQLETDLRRRHLPPPSSWKLICTTPIQLETDLRRRGRCACGIDANPACGDSRCVVLESPASRCHLRNAKTTTVRYRRKRTDNVGWI